ncbi:MAG: nucleotide exchange factor GrpE [Rickettsiales bacterium]|nr:nucleotide exchange factor GrpE [Rickettsiales bacterium]
MTENNKNIETEVETNTEEQQKSQTKWTDKFKSVKTDNSNNNDNDLIQKLTEENESLKAKVLRSLAEVENTRRICEEEKSKTMKFAITNFSKDLINIMENFYLAFGNLEKNTDDLESFIKGTELNFNEFKKIFEKNNIKRIYPVGEMFNPDFHDAISQIESDTETGTVIEVLQAGYTLNDRVIKPALVIVAK